MQAKSSAVLIVAQSWAYDWRAKTFVIDENGISLGFSGEIVLAKYQDDASSGWAFDVFINWSGDVLLHGAYLVHYSLTKEEIESSVRDAIAKVEAAILSRNWDVDNTLCPILGAI